MTVIRRSNPLGQRLALGRLLDRMDRIQEQPAGAAHERSRADASAKDRQIGRERGA